MSNGSDSGSSLSCIATLETHVRSARMRSSGDTVKADADAMCTAASRWTRRRIFCPLQDSRGSVDGGVPILLCHVLSEVPG